MNPEPIIPTHAASAAPPGLVSLYRPEGPPSPETAADPAYVAALERDLETYKAMFAESHGALMMIRASDGWRALRKYYRLRNRLLPEASRRRKVAKVLFHAARGLVGVLRRAARLPVRLLPQSWRRRKAVQALLRTVRRLTGGAAGPDDADAAWEVYADWLRRNEPGPEVLAWQRATRFARPVKISLVTPTYETPAAFLTAMIRSVREQTYADWELCIADGASNSPEVRAVLEEEARRDPRIRVVFLARNEGIAGNSAAALALATGDYVAFLDHDDLLPPFALFEIARAVNEDPDADLLYSDEDKIDAAGVRRSEPHFKPDWSPDMLRSHNYVCHLTAYGRALLEQVGGPRPGFDGSQDHDLILRASERAKKIVHIPKILYHWRIHGESTARAAGAKNYSHEAGRRALREHLGRLGLEGEVIDGPVPNSFHTTYRLPRRPLVSLIVPTHDQVPLLSRCMDSLARSGYDNLEILVVENNSKAPETFAYYRRLQERTDVRMMTWERPFNYAAVNNWAAAQARGEVLLFLNNDVEAINPDWIERLLEHALRPEVGGVGAKLYFPNDTIQHAGVLVGVGGVAAHAHGGFRRSDHGYFTRLGVVQNFTAVTGACLMMRKGVFEELGGFDEGFALAFNDVDLCMRLRRRGYLIVWTPLAELYHHESATRGSEDTPAKKERFRGEVHRFLVKWGDCLWRGDPYYNPNLTHEGGDFRLRV